MAITRTTTVVLAVMAAAALGVTTTASAMATLPASDADAVVKALPANPGKVTIQAKTLNGTGCKPGTAKVSMGSNNQSVNVIYSDFAAYTGKGIGAGEFRKNCQLGLLMKVPQGWTYSVNTIRHLGYVEVLGAGQKAMLNTKAYFSGDSTDVELSTTWGAKFKKNVDVKQTIAQQSMVWAPCGVERLLNLNTSLRVDKGKNANDFGMIALDSSKVKSQTYLNLSWKKC